jgi:3-oxoacyl-[acyl-carrier protein] reductase
MRLSGKTAIVTGGASGFGAGIARRFLAEGADVLIADIDAKALQAASADFGGRRFCIDVSRADDVERLREEAERLWPHVDILVNNAGIGHRPQALETLTLSDFERLYAVNMKQVYLTARAFVPDMKQRRGGTILNIASTGGVSPRPGLAWYNASKGWMIAATRAMAVELAPHGVRVNAINPVAGETPLLATFMGEDNPEIRQKFLASIPLGRFSTPDDVAAAAAFLCSDEASMVTGVALEVDGGRCL